MSEIELGLHNGDNLLLIDNYPDESINLIYVDPEFNKDVVFKTNIKDVRDPTNEIIRVDFNDKWIFSSNTLVELAHMKNVNHKLYSAINSVYEQMGKSGIVQYMIYMSKRILKYHQKLHITGTMCLHCDSTAEEYLNTIMRIVFGPRNLRRKIIWKRNMGSKNNTTVNLGNDFDVILYYTKSRKHFTYNQQYVPLSQQREKGYRSLSDDRGFYVSENLSTPNGGKGHLYTFVDRQGRSWESPRNGWRYPQDVLFDMENDDLLHYPKNGKRLRYKLYRDQSKGVPISNVWVDIPPNTDQDIATAKPVPLLDRVVKMFSNENDIVLDPNMGSGTTAIAAEWNNRKWIGFEYEFTTYVGSCERLGLDPNENNTNISFDSVNIVNLIPNCPEDFSIIGERLGNKKGEWFELLSVCRILGANGTQYVADGGKDGVKYIMVDEIGSIKTVYSSKFSATPDDVDTLFGVMVREKAKCGILTCIKITDGMIDRMHQHNNIYGKNTIKLFDAKNLYEMMVGKIINLPPKPSLQHLIDKMMEK